MENEKRLISDSEARRRIVAFATGLHSTVLPVDTVMMLLTQVPTVDAVEVVRCKDCKYFAIGGADQPWCRYENGLCDDVEPEYFCSYGERRTDG